MRMPRGESLRRAVRWISEEREARPDRSLAAFVDEASMRFNLSPKDAEFLLRFVRDAQRAEEPESGPDTSGA